MYIERTIGSIDLLVNPHAANEVFFEQSFLDQHSVYGNSLTPSQICELIAETSYIPMIMSWELLDKCSFKCPFCYIVGHSKHKVVRFKEMQPHIQELIDKGLFYCLLTGGEATIHPDFKEIYIFLKQQGVLVEVYTNGSLIDASIIETFREYKPYKIEVSIYAMSQEHFEGNTGTDKFNYQLVLDNILALKGNGINVVCKTPLNNLTENEFEAIRNWCQENDIPHYYSTSIYEGYDGADLNSYASSEKVQSKYDAIKFLGIETMYPKDEQVANTTPKGKTCYTCAIRKFGLHINGGFELMPCSETHFPESKSNIKEVGVDAAITKYRQFVDPLIGKSIIGCDGCEAAKVCKMCSAVATPVKNEDDQIVDFKVPEGHCESERKKVRGMMEYLLQQD